MSANKINNFKFTPDEFTLKTKDIDPYWMQILTEQSKEKKDPYTLLSTKTRTFLRPYFKEYPPKPIYLKDNLAATTPHEPFKLFFKKQ